MENVTPWIVTIGTTVLLTAALGYVAAIGLALFVPSDIVHRLDPEGDHECNDPEPKLGYPHKQGTQKYPPWQHAYELGKRIVGIVFLILGVCMLVLPGPGLIAIAVGVALTDLPGKRRAMFWLLSRPSVFHAINRIRRRCNKPPLL